MQSGHGPRAQNVDRWFSDPSIVSSLSMFIFLKRTRKLHIVTQRIGCSVFKVHLLWALFYWPCNLHYWSRNYSCHFKVKENRPKDLFPNLRCHHRSHIQVTTMPSVPSLQTPSRKTPLCGRLGHGTGKRSPIMRAWPGNLIHSKVLREFV